VISAANQAAGFSPGLAARVRCADGTRAFVKAAGLALNHETPGLHRTEGRIAAALPPGTPAPRLRHSYDDGDWVALVFDEVDGVMPVLPWRPEDLARVLTGLQALAAAMTPCPVPDAPAVTSTLAADMLGYQRLLDNPPDLDPWERRHLADLTVLAARSLSTMDGDTLLHVDVRADNVLLGPGGSVTFVDWPSASRGAAWIDTVVLAVNAALHGHDPETVLAGNPLVAGVPPTPFLAGLAGMWHDAARRPAPPGLPTIRGFQRAQGDTALDWVRRRTGWN
jgi:hypothetical protein